ncbi:unnamed protein product [Closterium sp. NIES-64]|nr:unnamed protein product [Closterium sp. NIES-64]
MMNIVPLLSSSPQFSPSFSPSPPPSPLPLSLPSSSLTPALPATRASRPAPPSRAADRRAALQQHRRAARATEQPDSRPPSRPAAEHPSRPAAEPPSSRAALQPSRPAVEPPDRRAALQPSRPAAQKPSRRSAEPPYCRAARAALSAIDFDVWVDDLQLFLQCDRADGLSLFDLTSCASPAPAADADATVCSQWATRDAAARLAVRRHLPTSERAHFSQYKSAQTLYDAVVARYSSPATAALSRLMLPYLFPDLAAFPTVADLITHLRTSDTRCHAALPADFCAKNPPPMYITLYYIVTRLPDSLRVVRDHFLSVCPTTLSVDLLEKSLLAAEKSIVAVGASRGDPRTPIFEGFSPSPLLPSVASAATADLLGLESVGAASAPSGRRRSGKGKGGKGVGGASGSGGVEAEAAAAVVVGAEVAEVVAVEAAAEAAVVAEAAEAAEAAGVAVELVAGLHRGVVPVVARANSSSAVERPCPLSSSCGGAHPTQRCFGRLTDAWRRQFPEATEIPRWGELSRAGVAINDLDFDAILSAMYAVSISDEGDCYRCFPPDSGIGTAALGTGEAAAPGACDAAALGASASASSGTGESVEQE